jgi:uncharacterized protein involved in type VI secretion and phage assembly
MLQFGIAYTFQHRLGTDNVLNESMVLMHIDRPVTPPVSRDNVKINDDAKFDTVANLNRKYRAPRRRQIVGGFNPLQPASPFYHDASVYPGLKLSGGSASEAQTPWLTATSFAEPVAAAKEAEDLATTRSYDSMVNAVTLTGSTKNFSFQSGCTFTIVKSDDDDPADVVDQAYLIDSLSLSCHDYNYENLFGWQALDLFFPTFSTLEGDSVNFSDAALAKVSMWVSNASQNQSSPILNASDHAAPGVLNWSHDGKVGSRLLDFAGQALSIAAWLGVQSIDIKKVIQDQKNEATFAAGFIAIPTKGQLIVPLPVATRPVARGPHTAVVVGDGAKSPQQDVFYDAIGRVRVRFPWDPGPPASDGTLPPPFPLSAPDKPTKTGSNTCWVRVVENWAGQGFGTQFLPRIGQEVVVDFLDGDPERPVIVGRLYNATGGPPNLPFPDATAAGQAIHTLADSVKHTSDKVPLQGIETRSAPMPAEESRYHLLRFDDEYKNEQLLLRSQGRLDVTAKECLFETTEGDRHVRVIKGKDKNGADCGGNAFTAIGGEFDLHVGGNRYQEVDKDNQLRVKGDTHLDLKGDLTAVVGKNVSINATNIVLEAKTKITLKVGGSTVVISSGGVYLDGPFVYKNCGGSPDTSSDVTIQQVADAKKADPGDPANARSPDYHCFGGGGRGGGSRSQTVPAQHAPAVAVDPKNHICVPL